MDEESSTGSEGSDDHSDTPLDIRCTRCCEHPPRDEVPLPASGSDITSRPCSEDCDRNSSASLDGTWKSGEAATAKVQNMQYPMADASSHAASKCGKTLEQSNLCEERQPLHRPEEAQHKEFAASLQPMTECHQQEGEHKDSLPLAAAQLPYDSLVSTEGGQHSCQLCTYVTKRKGNMNQHLRTHTGERPFQCSECARSFNKTSHLNRHIRIHRRERPFSCLRCHASFTESSTLVRHIRIHTGERPFSCVHCRASFTRRYHLNNHMSKCVMDKKP